MLFEAMEKTPHSLAPSSQRIVFFDGVCSLCNHFVDFAIQRNPEGDLLFAPLQGETAKTLLPQDSISQMNTLVFFENSHLYFRSTAALKIFSHLSLPWKLLGQISFYIPTGLRDMLYDLVSKNRYQLFGQRETCRIPAASERVRFLP